MNLQLGSRSLDLRLSERARAQLGREASPLDIEMEVYFSCLLRKRLRFLESPHTDVAARAALTQTVSISFRPVVTRSCSISDVVDEPAVEGVPLARAYAFTPKWLALDHAHGKWTGAFGY